MPTIWLVDDASEDIRWVQQALQVHCPQASLRLVASPQAWEEALTNEPWPDLIITEHHLGDLTAADILHTTVSQDLGIPVILFSDHSTDEEIAHLFNTGLTDYIAKTNRSPVIFAARIQHALKQHVSALTRRLTFLQKLDDSVFSGSDPHAIADRALGLLTDIAQALWGGSVFFNRREMHMAEVLATSHAWFVCPHHAGQKCPLAHLPAVPDAEGWTVLPIAKLQPAEFRQALARVGVRWLGVYRFAISEELVGLLYLGWKTKEGCSPTALQFAARTARWMSAIMYRSLQLEQDRRALRETKALNNLVLSLNRSLNVDTILSRLLEGLQTVAPHEQASIWLKNPDGNLEVRLLYGFGMSLAEFRQRLQNFPPPEEWTTTTILTHTRYPLLIPDTQRFEGWINLTTKPVRSWLGIPLVYDEDILGIITLDASEPHHFTAQNTYMAQTLASAAAIALQNARLYQHEQHRRKELDALRLASLQIVSSLDVSEVISALLQQTLSLVNADDAHVFLYDGNKLSFLAASWGGESRPRPYKEPRPNGITYTVARTGQPRIVPNFKKDPIFEGTSWEGAIISLPLIAHGEVRGVMNVAWHQPHQFTRSETDLLRMLADHAAIALENAYLVRSLQEKIEQMSLLSNASTLLRDTESVENLIQVLAEQALVVTQAEHVLIARFLDEKRTQVVIEHAIGFPKDLIGRFHTLQQGLIWKATQGNTPLVFRNLSQSPAFTHPTWVQHIGPAIAVPLHTPQNETVGMLLVGRPLEAKPFSQEDVTLLEALVDIGATALHRAQAHAQLEEAFMQTVLALSHAMDARDAYHGDHGKELAEWATAIAAEMGLSPEETETVRLAALLHDIGKIGTPDEILLKPGPLTAKEWEIMRQHPTIGAQILRALKALHPVADIVEAHHERWDGSGYPKGLKGEEIPLGARILAVVDSYAAMVDRRVYHEPKTHEEALKEIVRNAGRLYDPKVVEAFQAVFDYLNTPTD